MSSSEPLILVNGSPGASLSAMDRGLAYGDGVFRTLRMEAGRPVWWQDHLAKLEADCGRLALPAPKRSEWEQDLAWLAVRMPDAVIRLTVTRGPGPRGYRVPELVFPTRLAVATPLPDFPDPVAKTGARLRICDLRLGHQPRLAGIKHLNRLENTLARMEWDDPEVDEGILLDGEGWVVSGVMSNLLVRHSGAWLTPTLDRCGVAGVTRGRLIKSLAAQETRLTLDTLLTSEAILLCNSLVRLRWVAQLGDRPWARPAEYDNLMERLCSED
jgi:4-amino-4-deoxychorismate lyase